MNIKKFIEYVVDQNQSTEEEVSKAIDMFTSSVTSALAEGEEINLIGFGNFSVSKIPARQGRNPRTGEALQLKAYNQPKFKAGKNLKDAVNNK